MNVNCLYLRDFCSFLTVATLVFVIGTGVAQESSKVLVEPREESEGGAPAESKATPAVTKVLEATEMDLPGQFDKYFGMQPGSKLQKSLKPLSKIDMDGDLNYDGVISNYDSTDNGSREDIFPGLQIGVGELTKLVIRYKTYEKDYPGHLFVQLTVSGVNRFSANGKYSTDEEELDSIGRIKVWAEKDKKTLLLDSGDASKRVAEWKVDKDSLKVGLPGPLPRTVYVEGVGASQKFEGDLRLLISSSHSLSEGEARSPSSIYRTAFDHMLFTIREEPVPKGFVNDNAEGVWSNR